MTTVFDAIRSGDVDELRRLVTDDPSQARARDDQGVSALLHARYHGRHDMVASLLEAGVEPDAFEAAAVGDADRLGALVAVEPASVERWSADGFTPLHLAAFFGHEQCVRLLLDAGAPPDVPARNPMEVTPLHSAAAGRHPAIVRLLLENGADPAARQAGGYTPLHSAAANGDDESVGALLAHGAEPAAVADDGQTPADLATAAGHLVLAARLGGAPS